MRRHSPVFRLFVIMLCMLALAQLFAVSFSLYWVYLWLDIPMHAFGGAVVTLGYLALTERLALPAATRGFGAAVSVTLIVGLGWEAYELATGMVLRDIAPLGDTALDVLMGAVGAVLGYVLARLVGGTAL